MATPDRHEKHSMNQEFEQNSYAFDFFQAVRLLQALQPGKAGVGCSSLPGEEAVHFGQKPRLHFPASNLDGVEHGTIPKIYVNFLGLFGPNGALPVHLTEYAMRRRESMAAPDEGVSPLKPGNARTSPFSSFAQFCDIFHHRMISLFYRIGPASLSVKARPPKRYRFRS